MAIDISSIIQKHLTEEATSIEESTVEKTVVEETAVANTSGIQVDFESVVDEAIEATTTRLDENYEYFLSDSEVRRLRGAITSSAVASSVSV